MIDVKKVKYGIVTSYEMRKVPSSRLTSPWKFEFSKPNSVSVNSLASIGSSNSKNQVTVKTRDLVKPEPVVVPVTST